MMPLLRLSFRNLFRKNKFFTIINVLGLAIGLACVLLASLFIMDEFSFDRFHKNADRIYRIVLDFSEKGNTVNWARSSAPIAVNLTGKYPEIEQIARIRKNTGNDLLSNNEIKFYEERLLFVDSTLFKVFDFPLIEGDAKTALRNKNSVVITEALAIKYFADENAVGKTLKLNNSIDLKVTGIMYPIPGNSHIAADAFITFASLEGGTLSEKRLAHWGWMDHYTYVLLSEGASPVDVQSKFPDFIRQNAPEWVSEKETLLLQPLTSIHLHSDRKDEIGPNSNEKYSYILGTVALFILLMACANFINLSTATLMTRIKEFSIQKILGASRLQLTSYFWMEAILCAALALTLAYILTALSLPYFNLSTGKQIDLNDLKVLVVPSILLSVLIGFLSGIIPNIQAMKLHALGGIRAHTGLLSNKSGIRTVLITFQFAISIALLSITWVVSSQVNFLKSLRHGFVSRGTIAIPVKDRSQNDKHLTISKRLADVPGVTDVSFSSSIPATNNAYTYTYTFPGTDVDEQVIASFLVDGEFFKVYDIKLLEGRFIDSQSKDTLVDVVINRAAVEQFNLTDPIGRAVGGQVKGEIVGVVENFNFESLHTAVKPVIMYVYPSNFRFVSVNLNESDFLPQLAALDRTWQEIYPGYPMEYFAIDDRIQQLYGPEFRLSSAYDAFSTVAIFIAAIGLVGLSTYLLTRKLKEISIRKVFGGSTLQLVGWAYAGYVTIVIAATLVAWGIVYFLMNKWLEEFAFKVELSGIHFVMPAVIMIAVLLLATAIQTVRASVTNPINNLRDE